MKKSIIALMGLFTLVACSEDSYQEADKMSETGVVNNDSGGMQTNSYDPAIPYQSPYDFSVAGTPIHYVINNGTSFEIILTPYVGLAYFDGLDDGIYNHPLIPGGIVLSGGSYNRIYNGSEYLNLAEGLPILLGPLSDLDASPLYHCPTVNPNDVFFDLAGAGSTAAESTLLQDFGKIYYYKLEVVDPGVGVIYSNLFRYNFDSSTPGSPWNNMGVNTIFGDDLYTHGATNEIVCAFNNTLSEDTFVYLGNTYSARFISYANDVIFAVQP